MASQQLRAQGDAELRRAGVAPRAEPADEPDPDGADQSRAQHARRSPLPAESGGLDHGIIPRLIASAREAEYQIDWNANDKILLTATTTRWEELLRQ